jgi:hypothetical protein
MPSSKTRDVMVRLQNRTELVVKLFPQSKMGCITNTMLQPPNIGKPHLPHTTLISVDTTNRSEWSLRAIERSLQECSFGAVRFLTNRSDLKYAVRISNINGLDGYSKFCIEELHKYVDTQFALIVQYDGFVLRGKSWSDDFTKYDFTGAVFNPSGIVGNGGFSYRSKRLLDFTAKQKWHDFHPEDSCVSVRHRQEIEAAGMKIAPPEVARRFAIESRSWDSQEWRGTSNEWTSEFGFHSLLTPLPKEKRVCNVFSHAGDAGDIVYSLATIKALGGGMLFISPQNNYPYPRDTRWTREGGEASFVDNLAPLIEAQSYILKCRYTHGHPKSTTHDLNRFRLPWKERTAKDFDSIYQLHAAAFGLTLPEDEPWLTVPEPIKVPGRPIVVSRTARYQDLKFPWHDLVQEFSDKMVFVGTEQEAEIFQGFAVPKSIPHYKTANALELAQVIAGAKVFMGNQSLGLAIAHGLGKEAVVEQWEMNRNCRLNRPGVMYDNARELL